MLVILLSCLSFHPVIPSLPHRMVYAIGTSTSVLLYDTQQSAPFAIMANLHLAPISDLAWCADAPAPSPSLFPCQSSVLLTFHSMNHVQLVSGQPMAACSPSHRRMAFAPWSASRPLSLGPLFSCQKRRRLKALWTPCLHSPPPPRLVSPRQLQTLTALARPRYERSGVGTSTIHWWLQRRVIPVQISPKDKNKEQTTPTPGSTDAPVANSPQSSAKTSPKGKAGVWSCQPLSTLSRGVTPRFPQAHQTPSGRASAGYRSVCRRH